MNSNPISAINNSGMDPLERNQIMEKLLNKASAVPNQQDQATRQPKSEDKKKTQEFSGDKDVYLRYHVDQETNDVSVVMIDRKSRRVIRTIPPEELSQLEENQLVELLA